MYKRRKKQTVFAQRFEQQPVAKKFTQLSTGIYCQCEKDPYSIFEEDWTL